MVVLLIPVVLIMLLVVGGENVTIKSLSISQWNDHRDNREHCKEREVKNLLETVFQNLGVNLLTPANSNDVSGSDIRKHNESMTSFWNMSTASAPIHIHATSVK